MASSVPAKSINDLDEFLLQMVLNKLSIKEKVVIRRVSKSFKDQSFAGIYAIDLKGILSRRWLQLLSYVPNLNTVSLPVSKKNQHLVSKITEKYPNVKVIITAHVQDAILDDTTLKFSPNADENEQTYKLIDKIIFRVWRSDFLPTLNLTLALASNVTHFYYYERSFNDDFHVSNIFLAVQKLHLKKFKLNSDLKTKVKEVQRYQWTDADTNAFGSLLQIPSLVDVTIRVIGNDKMKDVMKKFVTCRRSYNFKRVVIFLGNKWTDGQLDSRAPINFWQSGLNQANVSIMDFVRRFAPKYRKFVFNFWREEKGVVDGEIERFKTRCPHFVFDVYTRYLKRKSMIHSYIQWYDHQYNFINAEQKVMSENNVPK